MGSLGVGMDRGRQSIACIRPRYAGSADGSGPRTRATRNLSAGGPAGWLVTGDNAALGLGGQLAGKIDAGART